MITIEEFRARVRAKDYEGLLDEVLLAEDALHVSGDKLLRIRAELSTKYGVAESTVEVRIVGSAKLGFATTTKKDSSGSILPRYRVFSATSDIDVMVISPAIFELIWGDLCSYAHKSQRLPWDSGRLGDYLVYGWLRPDKFPIQRRIRRCDDWWDVFRRFSADISFGRRKVHGGLFYSLEHARKYQMRTLIECSLAEEIEV